MNMLRHFALPTLALFLAFLSHPAKAAEVELLVTDSSGNAATQRMIVDGGISGFVPHRDSWGNVDGSNVEKTLRLKVKGLGNDLYVEGGNRVMECLRQGIADGSIRRLSIGKHGLYPDRRDKEDRDTAYALEQLGKRSNARTTGYSSFGLSNGWTTVENFSVELWNGRSARVLENSVAPNLGLCEVLAELRSKAAGTDVVDEGVEATGVDMKTEGDGKDGNQWRFHSPEGLGPEAQLPEPPQAAGRNAFEEITPDDWIKR
jgi:hypothetical protein